MPMVAAEAANCADSRKSWARLAVVLAMSTIGGAGMWCVVVALPAIQSEFGVTRGTASLPYTALMLGVALGSMVFGRLSDRFGIAPVAYCGTALLALGFVAAGFAPNLATFIAVHGLLIGLGCSASFGPLMSDISFWFERRRGIAVAVAASGNYFAGALWPPLVQTLIAHMGWRGALGLVGVIAAVTLVPLSLALNRFGARPVTQRPAETSRAADPQAAVGLPGSAVQLLLIIAGIGCCTAMAMPQVHIVAYCGDLGFGAVHGAAMLSLMLAFGVVSRVGSGFLADRLGGLATLLIGSMLQCLALILYMLFDGLGALYLISALFGLFQGGLVPSYAIIIREMFPGREAGRRFGTVLAATLVGMSFGGWLSGKIYDLSGSYELAFANGVAWNLLNLVIAGLLLWRATGRPEPMLDHPTAGLVT